jgi:hypothetical protein
MLQIEKIHTVGHFTVTHNLLVILLPTRALDSTNNSQQSKKHYHKLAFISTSLPL